MSFVKGSLGAFVIFNTILKLNCIVADIFSVLFLFIEQLLRSIVLCVRIIQMRNLQNARSFYYYGILKN